MSDNEHESAIKTPKQLIVAVLAGFLVPIIAIVLLVQYVVNDKKVGAGSSAQTPEAIAVRIQPVANEGFTFKDVSGPKVLQSGEAIYKTTCAACHDAGVAGAPKFADASAWGARIAQGYDILMEHALNGLRGMPAKGGNAELDEIEVARAVVHLTNSAGAKFKEPEIKTAESAAK